MLKLVPQDGKIALNASDDYTIKEYTIIFGLIETLKEAIMENLNKSCNEVRVIGFGKYDGIYTKERNKIKKQYHGEVEYLFG